jgi:sugar/nucleoside kinase (ribokinase family)
LLEAQRRTLHALLRYVIYFVRRMSFTIIVQYVLPPNSVVYTGCVGDDDLAEQLRAANKREGLHEAYYVSKGEQTGACAVVITGHDRYASLLSSAARSLIQMMGTDLL